MKLFFKNLFRKIKKALLSQVAGWVYFGTYLVSLVLILICAGSFWLRVGIIISHVGFGAMLWWAAKQPKGEEKKDGY